MADVIVIGGGIVGSAAAAFLAEGGVRVALFDGTGLASGASGANSGIVQQPTDPPMVPLYEETVRLYRELSAEAAGFELPRVPAGLLFLSRDPNAVRGIPATFPGLAADILGEGELRSLEPALAPGLVACRVPIGYPVPPSASTYAYATVAERRGVTIRTGRPADLVVAHGRVTGVRVAGRFEPADQVLVAAGPWSSEVIDPAGRWHPIRALWGVVADVDLADPPSHVLEEAEIEAVIGRASGAGDTTHFSLVTAAAVSAVGSTFLDARPDRSAWTVPLLTRASTFVPGLADASIRGVRACARPLSMDGRPLIGAIPGIDGLFVCAGHGPWGISTGPASARLVVDQMLGRIVDVMPELLAGRFGSPA